MHAVLFLGQFATCRDLFFPDLLVNNQGLTRITPVGLHPKKYRVWDGNDFGR